MLLYNFVLCSCKKYIVFIYLGYSLYAIHIWTILYTSNTLYTRSYNTPNQNKESKHEHVLKNFRLCQKKNWALHKFLPKITLVARQSPQCWSLQSFKSIFSQRPITHEFINNIFWLPIFYKRDSHKLNALLQFQLHKRFTWQNLNLSFILRFPLIVWIPLLWFFILSPEICLVLNYAHFY